MTETSVARTTARRRNIVSRVTTQYICTTSLKCSKICKETIQHLLTKKTTGSQNGQDACRITVPFQIFVDKVLTGYIEELFCFTIVIHTIHTRACLTAFLHGKRKTIQLCVNPVFVLTNGERTLWNRNSFVPIKQGRRVWGSGGGGGRG